MHNSTTEQEIAHYALVAQLMIIITVKLNHLKLLMVLITGISKLVAHGT